MGDRLVGVNYTTPDLVAKATGRAPVTSDMILTSVEAGWRVVEPLTAHI